MKMFGIEVSSLDLGVTCELLFKHLEFGEGVFIREDLNAHKVNLIRNDPLLRRFIEGSDIVNADGISLILAGFLLGGGLLPRVTGCDLCESVVRLCPSRNRRVFFIGAKKVVLDDLIAKISEEEGPNVVAGYRDGYFEDWEVDGIIDDIKDTGADFVFVGMPSPQKEMFEEKLRERTCQTMVLMGVGGSFDVMSGHVRRAPKLLQKVGLEWFFRLVQEPGRLWKRYLYGNAKFMVYLMFEVFRKFGSNKNV